MRLGLSVYNMLQLYQNFQQILIVLFTLHARDSGCSRLMMMMRMTMRAPSLAYVRETYMSVLLPLWVWDSGFRV